MAKEPKYPVTPAIHVLRQASVEFVPHLYKYEDKGGTSRSSEQLGVDEHVVVKTLVMENDSKEPMIVLMHGDKQVSLKNLARELGVKSVQPCQPAVADRHSGYQVGGTSPFGTKKAMPIVAQATIRDLDRIYINGGAKGFLIEIAVADLDRVLHPRWLEIAT